MKTVWTKFCRVCARFRVARGGNVAITFAFAVIPVIGSIGAAFDYSHANSVKADHAGRARLDRADAGEGRRHRPATATCKPRRANYFTALFNRPEATIDSISATYTASGGSRSW